MVDRVVRVDGADGGEALRDDWQRPLSARLAPDHPSFDTICARHDAAVAENIPTYIDPVSGYSVFTARFLARRRYCCESGCRHCPYDA